MCVQTKEAWLMNKVCRDGIANDSSPVHILMNHTVGEKGENGYQTIVQNGELLVEISAKEERLNRFVPRNYRLLRDPTITFHDTGVNTIPLAGAEADYLEGISDHNARIVEYRNQQRLRWIMRLRCGDMVYFKQQI